MRSSIESRRCGCNAIIGLRESCSVCTSRRRAELHASGVASFDGSLAERVYAKPIPEAARPPKPMPPWPIPAIGETCSYEVALRDMGNRPDARYRTDGQNGTSEYRGDPVCGLRNQNGWPSSFSGEYPLTCTWTRVA
jgi:hypothetical protein